MRLFDVETQENLLLYLVLPHFIKVNFLAPDDIAKIQQMNRVGNLIINTGEKANVYNEQHGYTDGCEGAAYPLIQIVGDQNRKRNHLGSVLEIGAGSGFLTAKLIQQSSRWRAVEPSYDFSEKLRSISTEHPTCKLEVIQSEIQEMEFPEREFDTIFLMYTLHHLIGRVSIFEKIGRWLKPGGMVYVLDPRHNIFRVVSLTRKFIQSYRKSKSKRLMTTHDYVSKIELRYLCRQNGLKLVRLSALDFPIVSRSYQKNRAMQYRFENVINRIPLIEHFGRFVFATITK